MRYFGLAGTGPRLKAGVTHFDYRVDYRVDYRAGEGTAEIA
jgi:hypothetical protein